MIPGAIMVKDQGQVIELRSAKLTVRVDRQSESISYFSPDGKPLLAEDASAPRTFEKTEVIKSVADPATVKKVMTVDGEREVAGKYVRTKDRDAWKAQVRFAFAADEAIYGLGFDETADLNLRGKTKRLYQHNLRKLIPSMVSTRGYGLLFDAYSAMTFADGSSGGSMSFDVVDDLDYYFIAGPTMDGAVAGYRELTGAAAMLPRWAFGYVQSKERYKSQDEIVATVKEFRNRKIPIDTIVQDWNYWLPGQWGALAMDPKFYPDPSAMTNAVHDQHVHLMLSIWPNPSEKSVAGKELLESGYTLAGTSFVNMFDPKARNLYWKFVWDDLGTHGIDAWWCDSTEPEGKDWSGKTRLADADAANIDALAKIIDPQLLNAYALEDSKGLYENWRRTVPDKRLVNLTRSGYAGGQRYGAILWSGDISAKWSVLARQVPSALNFSAAGYPYWTCDIGAFFVKRSKQWFWDGDYNKGVEDFGYRELYTRWFQFGTFLPMFRSHGTDTPREPWRFGEPGTPFYDAILKSINLRYRLMPYIYSVEGAVHFDNASFLRPVAFEFPDDVKTHDLKTQMLVGDALMVCPVLSPMYFDADSKPIENAAKSREVYLPEGTAWVDFWTGESNPGGATMTTDAPIDHIPVLARAGSIVPMGPAVAYADEEPDAPIELRIYPGADGTCTFYEDAGEGYGYEKGEFATTKISWDDASQTLKIGDRQGGFKGLIKQRLFRIVLVKPAHGTGLEAVTKADAEIQFSGNTQSVKVGK